MAPFTSSALTKLETVLGELLTLAKEKNKWVRGRGVVESEILTMVNRKEDVFEREPVK